MDEHAYRINNIEIILKSTINNFFYKIWILEYINSHLRCSVH